MISVLFAAKNSVYKTMTDSAGEPLDCWDEERDAMKWPGGNPVVAHPPCRLFSQLWHMSTAPLEEKWLAYWSVDRVREWGGVLEHPARSKLWGEKNLPAPGERDKWGFTYSLPQFWFGHPGQKWTWIYICGIGSADLPDIPMRFGHPENVFAGGSRKYIPGSRHSGIRSATPPAFARWLIETAERCQKPIQKPMEKIIPSKNVPFFGNIDTIECHGDCVDPVHVRVHVDPHAKPKERKKDDSDQMRLDLRFNPK